MLEPRKPLNPDLTAKVNALMTPYVPRVKTTLANPQDLTAKGRPSIRTADLAEQICAIIEETGVSNTAAASFCGVNKRTLSLWSIEDVDFLDLLTRARSKWQVATIRKLNSGHVANRDFCWLLQRQLSREYGDKIQVEHSGEIAQRVINPERLSELQARVGKASAS